MSNVRSVASAAVIEFSGRLQAKQTANLETAARKAASITPPFEHYSAVGFLTTTGGYPEKHQLPYDLSAIDDVIDSLAALRNTIINNANRVSNPEGDVISPPQFASLG